MTFLTILGVIEILCSFTLVLERKTGKEIPQSSRLEFSEKFLGKNFTLSKAEDNTSGLLNRGGIADIGGTGGIAGIADIGGTGGIAGIADTGGMAGIGGIAGIVDIGGRAGIADIGGIAGIADIGGIAGIAGTAVCYRLRKKRKKGSVVHLSLTDKVRKKLQ